MGTCGPSLLLIFIFKFGRRCCLFLRIDFYLCGSFSSVSAYQLTVCLYLDTAPRISGRICVVWVDEVVLLLPWWSTVSFVAQEFNGDVFAREWYHILEGIHVGGVFFFSLFWCCFLLLLCFFLYMWVLLWCICSFILYTHTDHRCYLSVMDLHTLCFPNLVPWMQIVTIPPLLEQFRLY